MGRAADLAGGFHVLTGYGAGGRAAAVLAGERFRVRLGVSVAAAPDHPPLFGPAG